MLPTDATNYLFFSDRDALVLSGGGARAAYQVGVLKAMAEWLPPETPCPFGVLVGTSAGALNAAAIAARAQRFQDGVRVLEDVWSNFHVEQVVRTDAWEMLRSGVHWMISVATGGWLSPPRSLLDTSPLRELLARTVPVERIPDAIAAGALHAVAVATTRARTFRPYFAAASSLASSNAQLPSLTPEALPAVTVPSGRTTPFN
jgi:NTE family protein